MMILRNGHREGTSYVFDGGYRLDRSGYLRVDSPQSGVISYGQAFQIDESGGRASQISTISLDGLQLALRQDPTNGRRILFLPQRGDLVIMSSDTFRSGFARRFLLDRFDANAYEHPKFAEGANPRKQPFFTQADWVSSQGSVLLLNMRGGYKIEVNLSTMKAKLPGYEDSIPFSFHRKLHDEKTGKLMDIPSKSSDQAKFHLIQTNTPFFVGERKYTIPTGGKSLLEISKSQGLVPAALAASLDCEQDVFFQEGEEITIPGSGYQLGQAWFFMDQEAFDSLLVRGYFMENLSPDKFEKIYSTSWGKVYRILAN